VPDEREGMTEPEIEALNGLETEVSLAVGVTNPDSGVSGSLLGWNAQGPAVRRDSVAR
jgi:hypothetical protein